MGQLKQAKKDLILAIDQGTTSSRAIIFDRQGRSVASAQKELTQHFRKPGWVEHDANEIWHGVCEVIRQALGQVGAGRVAAMGITNQRETTVLWDRKSGRPAAPAVVWQSRQSQEVCEDLKSKGLEKKFSKITGLRLDPYFSGSKVRHLFNTVKGLEKKAESGQLAFGTIDSWLLWNLTGGRVHGTDITNASRTLLMDLSRGEWSPWTLQKLGLPDQILPKIFPSSGIFGETQARFTGGVVLPIAGMAGDQQAALFGQGCFEPGMAKNTYGTGCFLLQHTGSRAVPSQFGLLTTAACGLGGEKAYALEGSVFVGGSAIQWLRDGLGFIKKASDSEALAQSVPDTGGVVVVPAFTGLGSPWWDPDARGAIYGLTRGTGPAHLARATLESIAFQSTDVLALMEKESGVKLKTLRVDGGASGNDFLMQTQADICQTVVERPKVIESTAFGAAALAGLAVGFWKGPKDLEGALTPFTKFRPKWNRDKARRALDQWHRAVEATRAYKPLKGSPTGL